MIFISYLFDNEVFMNLKYYVKIVKMKGVKIFLFKIDKFIHLVDIPCSPTAHWEWVLGERKECSFYKKTSFHSLNPLSPVTS